MQYLRFEGLGGIPELSHIGLVDAGAFGEVHEASFHTKALLTDSTLIVAQGRYSSPALNY